MKHVAEAFPRDVRVVRAASAFFCESIREEVQGTTTYIGQMPLNVTITDAEATSVNRASLPSFGIAVMIQFSVEDSISKIEVCSWGDWEKEKARAVIEGDEIKKNVDGAREKGHRMVVFWLKASVRPFFAALPGAYFVTVDFDGESRLAGEIHFARGVVEVYKAGNRLTVPPR